MRLRKLWIDDVPLMLEWMHDKKVVEYLNTDFISRTIDDCVAFIESSQNDKKNVHLAITDDADEYMGTISLKNIKNQTAEFAIAIRAIAMGKGYSKKAMERILNIGFGELDLLSIYWCVTPSNKRAVRFYEKNKYHRIKPNVAELLGGEYSKEQIQQYYWYMVTKDEYNRDKK